MIAAVPTQLLMDSMATRYEPARLAAPLAINIELTDRKEVIGIEAGKTVLLARVGSPIASPKATLKGPRRLILGLLFLKLPLAQLQAAGLTVEGDASAVAALQAALDPVPNGFTIVIP
jgi:alkyl sulfatase BDS1-like metallo-beta-lactamase superfamily hydrolase